VTRPEVHVTTDTHPCHEIIYRGQTCACVRQADSTYHVLALDGRLLGRIRWHGRVERYVFVPQSGTALDSGRLSEIGLWLRRLTRAHPTERRTTR
jgi:hypothetical protein